jgi:SpoVK/Ycf46/Vps4 family AAA+-type ATPase
VAARFQLSMRQIEYAARLARADALGRGSAELRAAHLVRGARAASRTRLGELARRLAGRRDWNDLILPETQLAELRSISAYLRHRDLVLGDWGYGEVVASQGLKVLFAGPSGTGKTLAAQVVAGDLGVDVFRVDLATVVSKYIGETERNLDRIFAAAEGSNAILFFDEADALFGKRSEVKDAHDRYANIEVAYLLQRMESYAGAVVLATNYRRNVDEAFLRRLDFAIDFPFPEAPERAQIWRRLVPEATPLADDVDTDALATSYELSGGSIRNCSVAAAFMAADDGGRVAMRHLVRAIAAEYRKNGRLMVDGDFATLG